jgi:hypothetical protein
VAGRGSKRTKQTIYFSGTTDVPFSFNVPSNMGLSTERRNLPCFRVNLRADVLRQNSPPATNRLVFVLFYRLCNSFILFKRKHRMHSDLKQGGHILLHHEKDRLQVPPHSSPAASPPTRQSYAAVDSATAVAHFSTASSTPPD